MNIDTFTTGRVIGETEDFVDVEIEGRDIRDMLVDFATKNSEIISKDEIEQMKPIITMLTRGDLFGKAINIRILKNIYAAANEKPEKTE